VVAVLLAVLSSFLLRNGAGESPGVTAPPTDRPDLPSTGAEPPELPRPSTPPTVIGPDPAPARPGDAGPGRNPASVPPHGPTPTPDLKDRFDEVDAALQELVTGHVAFNTPERMRFRESRSLALIASPKLDAATLSGELRERIGGNDPIAVEALQIAPLMEAQLEGAPAFAVTPLTPTRQPVSRSAPTEWRWNVRANEAGKQTLHLTINAVVMMEGERFPRSLDVLTREIEVEITALGRVGLFVQGNWQWLAGTVVIPVAVWLWTNRARSQRKPRK
jgi:hypothetical protein